MIIQILAPENANFVSVGQCSLPCSILITKTSMLFKNYVHKNHLKIFFFKEIHVPEVHNKRIIHPIPFVALDAYH